jgi:hypothetical protein
VGLHVLLLLLLLLLRLVFEDLSSVVLV